MNQNKAAGAYYEAAFRASAMAHHLHIYDPVGDYLPVDVIVQNNGGKLFRVQVRGSRFMSKDGVRISLRTGGRKKAYLSCSTYDVLAAYVADYNLWYLVPSSPLDGLNTLKVYPHVEKSRGQWEKFKENWDIFNASWA